MALEERFKEAFETCPICGGELVEKILEGGNETVALEADALVCRRYGERL